MPMGWYDDISKNYMTRSRLHRNKLGSNQFRTRTRPRRRGIKIGKHWVAIFFLATLMWLLIIGKLFGMWNDFMGGYRPANLVSPLAFTVNVMTADAHTQVEIVTPQQKEIIDFIKQTFGDDAPKAFQLLGCENSSLNPHAVNTAGNFPKGSRDLGIFQVNEYWQGVNAKFLLDYKINVMIAKKIFDDDGGSFKMWSCGRRLSI